MAELLTLTLDFAQYPLTRRALASHVQTPLGNGARQVRRRQAQPIYEFTLHIGQAIKSDMVPLMGFLTYVQHDIPFWFAGGEWGLVDTPTLFGIGDGARTEFFLPNRTITGALVAYLDAVLAAPQPTLDATAGLVTYATAPGAGVVLTATYTCRYQVLVYAGDETLMSQANTGKSLYSQEQLVLLEKVP